MSDAECEGYPSSVVREARARSVARWITGPSAMGSEKGTPTSMMSAPAPVESEDEVGSGLQVWIAGSDVGNEGLPACRLQLLKFFSILVMCVKSLQSGRDSVPSRGGWPNAGVLLVNEIGLQPAAPSARTCGFAAFLTALHPSAERRGVPRFLLPYQPHRFINVLIAASRRFTTAI